MPTPVDLTQLVPMASGDLARVGAPNDGGYVVPLGAVRDARYLISFGLSLDWSFEAAFVRHNPGVEVHCYDHTVSARRVAKHSFNHFIKLPYRPYRRIWHEAWKYPSYLLFFQDRLRHFHHQNRIWDEPGEGSVTIAEVFAQVAPRGGVFLKMDIEGAEYRVVESLAGFAGSIEALAIEFHDVPTQGEAFNAAMRVLRRDFHLVHLHGNNYRAATGGLPNVLELTFLNRRRFARTPEVSRLPYPVPGLDAPNNPARPELPLDFLSDSAGRKAPSDR